jgi:hypothetical protein
MWTWFGPFGSVDAASAWQVPSVMQVESEWVSVPCFTKA